MFSKFQVIKILLYFSTHVVGLDSVFSLNFILFVCPCKCIGGSKGGRQGRAPPWGSKFFHFHAVFGKNLENNSNFRSWRTPLGKILDPPLKCHNLPQIFYTFFNLYMIVSHYKLLARSGPFQGYFQLCVKKTVMEVGYARNMKSTRPI